MENLSNDTEIGKGLSPMQFYGSKSMPAKKGVYSKNHGNYKARSMNKKRDGGINRNVSHKIRKPKVSKKKAALGSSKITRMRAKPLRMPSRLATNRHTFKEGKKIKFHKLASPGVSLLENATNPKVSPQKKKFFTSRSQEAAVVNMSKTIKLSSVNGEISLASNQRILPKKNIGRKVEKELDDQIALGVLNTIRPENSSNGEPEDATSPRKVNGKISASTLIKEKISTHRDSPKKTDLVTKDRRISPRKLTLLKNSPCKQNISVVSPKRRCSPRKLSYRIRHLISPRRFAANNYAAERPANSSISNLSAEWTDEHSDHTICDADKSEDAILFELLSDNVTAKTEKVDIKNPLITMSPRRSPRKEMKNVKYFPIFEPRRKRLEKKMKEKRRTTKRSLTISDPKQMIIDAGQTVYGAVHCKSCDFLYEVGDPSEEKLHNGFHYGLSKALDFPGWKNEKQITNIDKHGGRILKIVVKDSSNWWRKVTDIIEIVDMDLGFVESGSLVKERSTAFLYVKNKSVSGCLIAEDIDMAYKFIQQVTGLNEGGLLCCSSVPQKAFVGVSRIWVASSERRTGIASALMDTMRSNMYPCHYLNTEEFAFSDPTEQGMNFAKKYTKINDFLVYRRSEAFLKNNLT